MPPSETMTNTNGVIPVLGKETGPVKADTATKVAEALKRPPVTLTRTVTQPKSVTLIDTSDIVSPFFRCVVYGDTNRRKTSAISLIDAHGIPYPGAQDRVRIISSREKEQLLPLYDLGYKAAIIKDADGFNWAIQNLVTMWPDWWALPAAERWLAIDDVSRVYDMILNDSDNSSKDERKPYLYASATFEEQLDYLKRLDCHLAMSAGQRVDENEAANREEVLPDFPKSAAKPFKLAFEFIFHVNEKEQLLTEEETETITKGEGNRKESWRRTTFAKSKFKLAELAGGKKPINTKEPIDLWALWLKIQSSRLNATKALTGGNK